MRFVTLDTGYKGGMVLFVDNRPVEGFLFSKVGKGINLHEIDHQLKIWKPGRVFIEIFPPQPYQGVTTTASQWRVVGSLETLCQLNCTTVEYIYVATWTAFAKRLSMIPSQPNKKISQELTERFFPEFAKQFKKRKNYNDAIADCLAMATYVLRDNFIDEIQEDELYNL